MIIWRALTGTDWRAVDHRATSMVERRPKWAPLLGSRGPSFGSTHTRLGSRRSRGRRNASQALPGPPTLLFVTKIKRRPDDQACTRRIRGRYRSSAASTKFVGPRVGPERGVTIHHSPLTTHHTFSARLRPFRCASHIHIPSLPIPVLSHSSLLHLGAVVHYSLLALPSSRLSTLRFSTQTS